MDCPKCQHENQPGKKFCGKCGTALNLICPACQSENPAEDQFCGECGHDLSQSAQPSQPTAPSIVAAEGERRQATVLFSDLSGFTAMTEKLDPEDVQGFMRRLKDRAVKIVEAHGGIVNQFVGDEVLALFGIPSAHEDDPVRAVRAAQEIHALARELSPEVEEKIGRPLRMHTGIDSGLVVTSTADARDGTVGVTGDTVNTDARLKALATDDEILVSSETQRLVVDFFETEALEALKLKGKAEPVLPHRVTSAKGIETRFEAAAARGLTPFTGRTGELATLHSALDKGLAGEGQFVTVIGEPGVGKSRLAYEFRHSIEGDTITVLEGRYQSYGAEIPYLPFLDALRRALQIHELENVAALHDIAVANILAIDPALERYVPHLLHLLSIPSDTHKLPERVQGDALRRELEEALVGAFIQGTRHGPTVVIFEDWHWADDASDAALQHLTNLVGHHPLLLLILYRPEYTRAWGEMEHYTAIVLKALDVANTEAMLRSVIGADSLPEGLGAHVHARTGGNALFNEEVARSLIEEQIVTVNGGAADLGRPLEDLHLPDSVQGVIRARVDRLDPDSREVLRLASVIGREFDRAVLERLYPSPAKLEQALSSLRRQDLVHQVRVVPQAEYIFKHVLTQVVVYETLLLQQRKELHAKVGHAIESLYAERLEQHYEALANHYSQSEEVDKAVEYLEKAGDKAAKYHSLVEARERFRAVIRILDDSTPAGHGRANRIDVSLKWAQVSHYAASEEHMKILDASMSWAEELDDLPRIAEVTYWLGRIHYVLGHPNEALQRFRACLSSAEQLKLEHLLGPTYTILGRTLQYTREIHSGIGFIEKGLPLVERLGRFDDVVYSKAIMGYMCSLGGDFCKGFATGHEAVEVARRESVLSFEAVAHMCIGLSWLLNGQWDKTIVCMTVSRDLCRNLRDHLLEDLAVAYLGYPIFMAGDKAGGVANLEGGIRGLEASGSDLHLSMCYGLLAELRALTNDDVGVGACVGRIESLSDSGQREGDACALRATAMVAAQGRDPDWAHASDTMDRAVSVANRLTLKPEAAVTHFRYAECLHKKGDLDAAREQLDQAEALFRDMGMDWWLEQAEGLRGRIDSGEPFKWFVPYVDGPPTN